MWSGTATLSTQQWCGVLALSMGLVLNGHGQLSATTPPPPPAPAAGLVAADGVVHLSSMVRQD